MCYCILMPVTAVFFSNTDTFIVRFGILVTDACETNEIVGCACSITCAKILCVTALFALGTLTFTGSYAFFTLIVARMTVVVRSKVESGSAKTASEAMSYPSMLTDVSALIRNVFAIFILCAFIIGVTLRTVIVLRSNTFITGCVTSFTVTIFCTVLVVFTAGVPNSETYRADWIIHQICMAITSTNGNALIV